MGKIAIMTYGRFQPPHIQHRVLFDELLEQSKVLEEENKQKVTPFIFTSQSSNKFGDSFKKNSYIKDKTYKKMQQTATFCSFKKNENPIPISKKLGYLRKINDTVYSEFPTLYNKNTNVTLVDVIKEKIKSPIHAVIWLKRKQYDKIYFYVGLDRAAHFIRAFENNPDIEVIFGPRDENSPSGTTTREHALKNDFFAFKKVVDKNNDIFSDEELREMIQVIRDGTEVNNDITFGDYEDFNNPDVCKDSYKWKTPKNWGKDWRKRKTYNTRRKKRIEDKKIEIARKKKELKLQEHDSYNISDLFKNLKIGGRCRRKTLKKRRKNKRKTRKKKGGGRKKRKKRKTIRKR